jgi:hypothetical protein
MNVLHRKPKPIIRPVSSWYAGVDPDDVCSDCMDAAKYHLVRIFKGHGEIVSCYPPNKKAHICRFFMPNKGGD